MKTRLRSTIELALTLGLILIAILAFGYFYSQTNKRQKKLIEEKKGRLVSLNQAFEKAQADLETRKTQVSDLEKQVADRKKEIEEKFENLLESGENYTQFIAQVQKKAREFNVSILGSSYESPTPVTKILTRYLEFKFVVIVNGSYENMKHFLWGLENTLGRFVKISNMVVDTPISNSEGNMKINLTLSTYFKASNSF